MTQLFIFLMLALQQPAFAIENLIDCEAGLTGEIEISPGLKVPIAADEVVYRGFLEARWATGMEAQAMWTIRDEQLAREVTPDVFLQSRVLKPGMRIFLVGSDGSFELSGYYAEIREYRMHER